MDTRTGVSVTALVYEREALDAGARVSGPAVIVEKDTATVVSAAFDAAIHPQGHIIMSRKGTA